MTVDRYTAAQFTNTNSHKTSTWKGEKLKLCSTLCIYYWSHLQHSSPATHSHPHTRWATGKWEKKLDIANKRNQYTKEAKKNIYEEDIDVISIELMKVILQIRNIAYRRGTEIDHIWSLNWSFHGPIHEPNGSFIRPLSHRRKTRSWEPKCYPLWV